jgi:uncharacterized protein (TIGR02996 family)
MSDEKPFIEAILADPDDDAPRLIYADWLEDRGDPRGEYLRLDAEVVRLPEGDPRRAECVSRLGALRAAVDPEWAAVVDRTRIEGCSRVEHEGSFRVRFDVECPMRWQSLKRTGDPLVRFCEGCKKKVFYCGTVEQARRHAWFGHCIAVDSHATRAEGDVPINSFRDPEQQMLLLGVPAPPAPRFHTGQRVRIRSGLFAGQEGEITKLRLAHLRATVEVLAGQLRPTQELSFEDLEPLALPGAVVAQGGAANDAWGQPSAISRSASSHVGQGR